MCPVSYCADYLHENARYKPVRLPGNSFKPPPLQVAKLDSEIYILKKIHSECQQIFCTTKHKQICLIYEYFLISDISSGTFDDDITWNPDEYLTDTFKMDNEVKDIASFMYTDFNIFLC